MAMGTLYSMKGQSDVAVPLLEKSVKAKPAGQSWAVLAAAYGELGRIDDAVAAFRKALALEPGNLVANFNLAGIYMQANAFSEAVPLLERVVKARPQEGEPAYMLALAYAASGQPGPSRALLLKLPQAARDTEQVLLLLGSNSTALGDQYDALKYYERAVELNPISSGALANLGSLLLKQGKTDRAIELLDKAFKLEKTNYLAGITLATAYRESGKPEQTRSVLSTLLTKGETAEIYVLLGQAEDDLKNHDAAIRNFVRATELDPSEGVQFYVGYSHLRAGKPDLADAAFRAALGKLPLSTRLRMGLGLALLAENKAPQAVEELKAFSDKDTQKDNPLGFKLLQAASTGAKDEAHIKQLIEELKPKPQ